MITDPDTRDMLNRLSVPGTTFGLTRRRFLQLGAVSAGAGAIASSPLLSQLEAFAAPPLGGHDTILVLVMLSGGNDSLNMVVPYADANYRALRPTIRLSSNQTLNINSTVGLHPSLAHIKAMYDQGHVAIVRGVGYASPDFSHFTSMGYWMQGWGGAAQSVPTGWIGRYVDNFPNAASESLYAVTLGTNGVPLHLIGAESRAASLPLSIYGRFGIDRSNGDDQRLCAGLGALGAAGRTGLGHWGDEIANTTKAVMSLTSRIAPAYPANQNSDYFVAQMELVGNLVNRNLGTRVFNVTLDGFDTHTDQLTQQAGLFTSLDRGVSKLMSTLSPSWRDNVVVMTFSEFGRRPEEDDGRGTDHGTAGSLFVMGQRVKGGLYGQQPSLAQNALVDYGNLAANVDYRSVYATLLAKWLKADDKQVLGKTYSQLGFIASTP
jgi:uncharacterized protein (DUF1501 family)